MRNTAKMKRVFCSLLAVASLFASSPAFPQGREFERSRVGSLPATQTRYAGGGEAGDYRIMAGDLISIAVWREPELTRDVRVRPDGQFSYPLIGQVRAAGSTVEELQQNMKERLIVYMKFPELIVEVKETSGSIVVVLGEVIYPGAYAYKGQGDVLTAIGLAGDFTRDAKRESILVISDNFTDKPKVRRVNVFGSFYHGTKGANFLLKPGDVIYVPRTFIADWNKTVNDLQPTLNSLLGQDFQNLYQDRGYIRTMYYNKDKPVAKDSI
jgi:polysaccharide export outer membrane protein